jgi:membrane protein insertase Oxa1/YidC/SpoIIIJ
MLYFVSSILTFDLRRTKNHQCRCFVVSLWPKQELLSLYWIWHDEINVEQSMVLMLKIEVHLQNLGRLTR